MNKTKSNSYGKLLVFFLVAIALLCAFGFAADGWQLNTDSKPDSGSADNNNGEADENTNGDTAGDNSEQSPNKPEMYIPEYINYITGTETTEQLSLTRPKAFIMSTAAPLYGISSSELMIEFPMEDGSTRLLSFITDTSALGKIGSVTPTRAYISNLAKAFGGILVSNGKDDKRVYESLSILGSHFDFSLYPDYHYTEYTHYSYTNSDLINSGILNANISSLVNSRPTLPYQFVEFGNDEVIGDKPALKVTLPFSELSDTELRYSSKDGCYSFMKGGALKKDMLNDKGVSFKNVFILFADSVTYEGEAGVEMIMDTMSGGKGYYLSDGTLMRILWSVDEGQLTFTNENGETLVVNRGTSYIGFMKSSKINDITFN